MQFNAKKKKKTEKLHVWFFLKLEKHNLAQIPHKFFLKNRAS